ncbi:MAG: DUF2383 domain-containing protein [Planctomycetota bacterium]|jgi:hypothetical protein|nr:DUF2383 domain-containing protein [Planctomycetota bacterium]
MTIHDTVTDQQVTTMNRFLRGERAAVETYSRSIARMDQVPPELFEARRLHIERVDLLSRHVWKLGADPDLDSGYWGSFANVMTTIAAAIGDGSALMVLEQGETMGTDDYLDGLTDLPEPSRGLLKDEILPRQHKSQVIIGTLRERTAQ